MVFNLKVSLANFDSEQRPTRNCLQISDTVIINSDEPVEYLTKKTSRKYENISYTINEEEDEIDSDDHVEGHDDEEAIVN